MLLQKRVTGTIGYIGGLPAVLEEWSFAYLQMCLYTQMYHCDAMSRIHVIRSKTSYHAKARNELAKNMLGDWIFMCDTDHLPAPDLCIRMLRLLYKYNIEVLVGVYQIKVWPYTPLLMVWNEDKTGFEMISKLDPRGAEVVKIDAAGAGCLLVRRTTLVRMVTECEGELPFDIIKPFSEDFSFFKRLSTLKIDTYVAPAIHNPHLVIIPVEPDWCEPDAKGMYKERMETIGMKK